MTELSRNQSHSLSLRSRSYALLHLTGWMCNCHAGVDMAMERKDKEGMKDCVCVNILLWAWCWCNIQRPRRDDVLLLRGSIDAQDVRCLLRRYGAAALLCFVRVLRCVFCAELWLRLPAWYFASALAATVSLVPACSVYFDSLLWGLAVAFVLVGAMDWVWIWGWAGECVEWTLGGIRRTSGSWAGKGREKHGGGTRKLVKIALQLGLASRGGVGGLEIG